jgi:hypothetical protein
MPTIADLYNLIVQATNAVIHAIHGVGLMLFTLGLVYMTKALIHEIGFLISARHCNRSWRVYYALSGVCYLAGIAVFIFVVM